MSLAAVPPPTDHVVEMCECGHLSTDHVRVVYAAFVCSSCSCDDHASVIPDDDTEADLLLLATCWLPK